jgi:hypothetical protein
MMIQLKVAVKVRAPSGQFVTVPAGALVNYRSERGPAGDMIHRFSCFAKDRTTILHYVEVGPEPDWL